MISKPIFVINGWSIFCEMALRQSGPWFNIKMPSYQYRKSHCGDNKMIVRSSYLHNGISYTGKMTSLYWTSPQESLAVTYHKSTLVEVMALCHQATSSMSPYGVNTGQWVNIKSESFCNIFPENAIENACSKRDPFGPVLNALAAIGINFRRQLSLPNPLKPGVKSRMKM